MSARTRAERDGETRTARDLHARGYRIVGVGRTRDYGNGGWTPPSYKLVVLDATPDSPWLGLIRGKPTGRSLERVRRFGGRQTVGSYLAYGLTKRGEIARRPIGEFATTVAAAHTIVDRIEADR